jgi:hypothetical protein
MNDLIGLAYRWGCRPGDGSGCTDCFQLVCAVRRQLGLPDHAAQFEWVYREHTAETFGLLYLRRLLASLADPVAAALPGDPILLGGAAAALGVAVDGGVMFIAPGQTVVMTPLPQGAGQCYRLR